MIRDSGYVADDYGLGDPDNSQRLFDMYITWLYSQRLATKSSACPKENDGEYVRLMELYELGIYLKDTKFQNAIIDAFIARNSSPVLSFASDDDAALVVRKCYDRDKSQTSKMRDLLVTIFADKATSRDLDGPRYEQVEAHEWPEAFVKEVKRKLLHTLSQHGEKDLGVVAKLLDLKAILQGPSEYREHIAVGEHSTACDFHIHAEGENWSCRNDQVRFMVDGVEPRETRYPPRSKKRKRVYGTASFEQTLS